MSSQRDKAVELVSHYFERFSQGKHWPPDGDNRAEWEDLVDAIIDAAAERVMTDLESMEHRR